MLVIYFHGFGSGADTNKVQLLKNAGFNVVSTDINIDPEVADKELTAFVKATILKNRNSPKFVFVGTSLGGFWAARMGDKFDCMAVLINPAMHPEKSLKQYVGKNKNFQTGKEFEVSKEIVDKYKKYPLGESNRYRTFFVSKDDEIVKAVKKVEGAEGKYIEFDSNDHRGLTILPHVIKHLKSI